MLTTSIKSKLNRITQTNVYKFTNIERKSLKYQLRMDVLTFTLQICYVYRVDQIISEILNFLNRKDDSKIKQGS